MPSELQRVAQALLAALDEIPRVVGYLQRTAQNCREQAGLLGGESRNPTAQMAALQLEEAARRCDEAAHHLSQAPQKARSWAEQMVSGVRATEPATRRGSEIDLNVREILERLPVRGRKDKTRGIWIDPNGIELDLASGIDEYTGDAERLIVEEGLDIAPGDVTLGAHVEIKFAMLMRRRGLLDETIVINNRPCEGPYSCDENLEQFLPSGAKLTVYGPGNFKKTYPEPSTGSEEPPA